MSRPGPSNDNTSRQLQRSQGYVEEVFDIIRADIMALRIPPDARISIDSLARNLGVSQTPIREALSMLEAIGLVTKQRYVGYCTAPQLDRRQWDELFEARLLMEPYAARRAAERMDTDALRRLARAAQAMKPGRSPIAYDQFADQDAELHDLIAAGGGNAIIREALARLHAHLHIFRLRSNSDVGAEVYAEHAKLVDALVRRDGPAAEAAMREHLEKSYHRLQPPAEA